MKRLLAMLLVLVPCAAFAAEPVPMDTYSVVTYNTASATLCKGPDCFSLTLPQQADSCSDADMQDAFELTGVRSHIPQGMEVTNPQTLFMAMEEKPVESVKGNFATCFRKGRVEIGIFCYAVTGPDQYDICIGPVTRTAAKVPVAPKPATETAAVTPATPGDTALLTTAVELYGIAHHKEEGHIITITFGDDAGNQTLDFWTGPAVENRSAACQVVKLREAFSASTPGFEPGSGPGTSFNQLQDVLKADADDTAYTWFSSCERKDQTVAGLLCIAPSGRRNQAPVLRACTFVEGMLNRQ